MAEKATSKASGNKPPFVYWVSMWVAGSAFAVVAIFVDLFLKNNISFIVGRDFSNMWTAGRLALEGMTYRAFDVNLFRLEINDRLGILTLQNFSYPPSALVIDAPFAILPYFPALLLWTLASVAFFIWAARPFLPIGFPPLLAALTPGATICIWDGQYGLFIGGLWLIAYAWADRQPMRAGIAAGLMTIKPHLGVLVAAMLLLRPRAMVLAILTAIGLIVLSGALFGWANWSDFLFTTSFGQAVILTGDPEGFYFRMMPTAYPAYGQGAFGMTIQAAFALFALWKMWRIRHAGPMKLAFPSATATFLILPYAFNYDMTVASLGFAVLLFDNWRDFTRHNRIVAVAAFVTPQLTFLYAPLVPVILACGLSLQCSKIARREDRRLSLLPTGSLPLRSVYNEVKASRLASFNWKNCGALGLFTRSFWDVIRTCRPDGPILSGSKIYHGPGK